MTKRVADVLIETLQAAGVERCYGIVGDTLNQIAHAIDRSAIQWVHMRHEEAVNLTSSSQTLGVCHVPDQPGRLQRLGVCFARVESSR